LSESERSAEENKTELIPNSETREDVAPTGRPVPTSGPPVMPMTPMPAAGPLTPPAASAPAGPTAPPAASASVPPAPAPPAAASAPAAPAPAARPAGSVDLPTGPMSATDLPRPYPRPNPIDVPTGPMSVADLADAPWYERSTEVQSVVPRTPFVPPELLARRQAAPHSASFALPQLQQAPAAANGTRRPPSGQVPPNGTAHVAPAPGGPAPANPAPAGPGGGPGRRPAMILGAVAIAAILVIAVVLVKIHNESGSSGKAAPPKATPSVVATVSTVKPNLTGIDFAHGTSFRLRNGVWVSSWYTTTAFGNLKDGIGLQMDLGSAQAVTSVSFQADSGPLTVDLRAADQPESKLSDYSKASDSVTAEVGGKTTLDASASAGKHRYWMIWVSQLGTNHKAEIRDSVSVKVKS